MWFLGAVLGFIFGLGLGTEGGSVVFAIVGAILAQRYGKQLLAQPNPADLLKRIERLEQQVAELQAQQTRQSSPTAAVVSTVITPLESPPVAAEEAPPAAPLVVEPVVLVSPQAVSLAAEPPSATATAEVASAAAREDQAPPPIDSRSAAVPTTAPSVEEATPPPQPFPRPDWLQRLAAGNPLAKVGVALLFFGVASGLKLAIEYGFFPIWLRLLLTSAGGLGLIGFGAVKARHVSHRGFGLALQGGGFALLYLVVYFMLARYAMLERTPAFVAFALLGVLCTVLAARQNGPALAVLGISGAFLAPALAGGHSDTPVPLFSYFALLNVFVLGVNWLKAWPSLNITGFVLTLLLCTGWSLEHYRPSHYPATQAFVVLFLAAYSAMPMLTALLRAPGFSAWHQGLLLFGAPTAGMVLQTVLVSDREYGLAWSALIGGMWYLLLAGLLRRRREPANRLVELAHLGIGGTFLTLAIPLAFGAQLTSALWALEGSALVWLGTRRQHRLSLIAGLLLQLFAGSVLLNDWTQLKRTYPLANDATLGAAILVVSGLFSARQMLPRPMTATPLALLPLLWALLWWLGGGFDEIHYWLRSDAWPAGMLLFVAATALALEMLARRWQWPFLTAGKLLLLAALGLSAIIASSLDGHPAHGWMALALPMAWLIYGFLLHAHDCLAKTPPTPPAWLPQLTVLYHGLGWWLLLGIVLTESNWHIRQWAPANELWPWASTVLILSIGVLLPNRGALSRRWPFALPAARYAEVVSPPLIVLLLGTLVLGNLSLSGEGSGIAYLPLLSVFDAVLIVGLWGSAAASKVFSPAHRRSVQIALQGVAFIGLSALAARLAHRFSGVPFDAEALLASNYFHASLTLIWTICAIATMTLASRRKERQRWFIGFGLLAMVGVKLLLFDVSGRGSITWTLTLLGVAVLVLAASYFAPVPPRPAPANTPPPSD